MNDALQVEIPRRVGPDARVMARVDGNEVWFESQDVELSPSCEAFGSAFLIPALLRGRRLGMAGPVASDWAAHTADIARIIHRWWGAPVLLPTFAAGAPVPRAIARGTVLCFSGGVDSFFTLLRGGERPDWLVFVHGFDVPLTDGQRADWAREDLEAAAASVGARPVTIRTGLRSHPAFACVSWERTHGGALAAIGHLLSGVGDRLLVSSTLSTDDLHPWGSHVALDHLWAGGGLQIRHVGADLDRIGKLRQIADEPLVRSHLRVCWENRDARRNCSRCEKCVRTRLSLAILGCLEEFPVFDGPGTLARDVDGVASVPAWQLTDRFVYAQVLQAGLPAELRAAVRRLLARSRRHEWGRRLRQFVRRH
ncbi:MAG TPA: hypothetical protein VFN83_05070 [Gemmatimonadales bacterium]|nr:hypothetical protein [Gemmatimonadales bacterium]